MCSFYYVTCETYENETRNSWDSWFGKLYKTYCEKKEFVRPVILQRVNTKYIKTLGETENVKQ